MNIYFAASTGGILKYRKNYETIIKLLKKLGHKVTKNWIVAKLEKGLSKPPRLTVQSEAEALANSDLVIVEASIPSFGIGYQLSQAVKQRKPILALYLDSLNKKEVSDQIAGFESSLLTLEFYNLNNLEKVLRKHLAKTKLGFLSKFNFVISPEIASYLDWGTYVSEKTKSEFLRDKIINEIIKKDKEYLTHLQKEHKNPSRQSLK